MLAHFFFRCCVNLQLPGDMIQYVDNDASKAVLGALEECLKSMHTKNFRSPAIFAYGASGSGKSRLGLQAAHMLREKGLLTGYLCQNMDKVSLGLPAVSTTEDALQLKDQHTPVAAEFLKQRLINRNFIDTGLNEKEIDELSQMDLSKVMKQWAEDIRKQNPRIATTGNAATTQEKDKRLVMLVMHLDEVHRAEWPTACFIRAIAQASDDLLHQGICAVPISTGFSTDVAKALTEAISTGEKMDTHVKFFSVIEQEQRIRTVAVNVFNAVLANSVPGWARERYNQQLDLTAARKKHQVELEQVRQQINDLKSNEDKQEQVEQLKQRRISLEQQLRNIDVRLDKLNSQEFTEKHLTTISSLDFLLKDTGGWTLGLVFFGVACAAQTNTVTVPALEWNFAQVEANIMRQLVQVYDSIDNILVRFLGMKPDGLPKLLCMVMSPFKVCGGLAQWVLAFWSARLGSHAMLCSPLVTR